MDNSYMYTDFMNSSNTTEHYSTENNTDHYHYYYIFQILEISAIVIDICILVIGLPTICLAIYSLYRLVRADMVVPIYMINLLISDLLQILARPFNLVSRMTQNYNMIADVTFVIMLFVGLVASIGFMLCIALDRYLVVAHPLWYRYRRSIRHATLISVAVWLLPLAVPAIHYIFSLTEVYILCYIVLSIILLLPFPLFIFFFIGTWRAIAGATSVRDEEKRRIVRMLALVLGTYTVLFLPFCIVYLIYIFPYYTLVSWSTLIITVRIVELSVLVDPVLYVLLRSDVRNTLRSLPCCQRPFTLTNCWSSRAEQEETENTATVCPTETSV